MNGQAISTGARRQVNILLTAVMFLTRIPVGCVCRFQTEHLARSVVYFPLVGMLIGAAGAAVLKLAKPWLPSQLAVLFCMAATVALTGGLHEDGLADAADGLIGGQTPERRLEIMKDSRIGSYGVLALWFSLTTKFVLLNSLLAKGIDLVLFALIVAHMLGRSSAVVLLCALPYRHSEKSKSKPFCAGLPAPQLALALVIPVGLALALLRQNGVACVVAAAVATLASCVYFHRKIGGVTGDCLGAANQIVELSCYSALLLRLG